MKRILLAIFTLTLAVAGAISAQTPGGVLFKTLVSFTYTNGPYYGGGTGGPRSSGMVKANDGNFYGATYYGGPFGAVIGGFGTIFKMTPDGTFTTIYCFGTVTNSGGDPLDGQWPVCNLIQGNNGLLYGTTEYVGASGPGAIFSITTNGVLNSMPFPENWPDAPLGASPNAGMVQGSDGNFYGTTSEGTNLSNTDTSGDDGGTVFEITSEGAFINLHSFNGVPTNTYFFNYYYPGGQMPHGELVEGDDGNFYGTTEQGGDLYSYGTIFRIARDGTFTNLVSFNSTNGALPEAGLCKGSDGSFYGTTSQGGTNGNGGDGTIFKITTNGVFTTLYEFGASSEDGNGPAAALIQGSDGNFYGTTKWNNNSNTPWGTVFKVTTNGVLTTLYSFSATVGGIGPIGANADGAFAEAKLVQGSNGDLYGETCYGGAYGYGTIFRITIPPAFQSVTQSNGMFNFVWSIMPGQKYQLQSNTTLNGTNWLNLGSSAIASSATVSGSDSTTNSQCFYRIMLLQ